MKIFGMAKWTWQGWVYTPAVTVWTFLAQCLSADHSCREAVARMLGWRLAHGQQACSADTGAYCTARDRLPEDVCRNLVRHTGREVDDQTPSEWLWRGRRVRSVDGSTMTMPDTQANQAEYPQVANQLPGCGFPIARVVIVFSLAVGTVLDAAIGKYQGKQTGENSLFRQLHELLEGNDVLLADRYFSGWFDIALLRQRGVDVVERQHQRRFTDFRRGQRLGPHDHVVIWEKPARPTWMSPAEYDSLPGELPIREVRVTVRQKGFRTRQLIVITSLLDDEEFSAADLAALYRRRWQAELNLRSLKTVLQMDHLRCKTPHRVRNEFYMHLVGYNLIRFAIAAAARHSGVEPWEISFKGALQTCNQLLPQLNSNISTADWCQAVLDVIATHDVGNRPDRFEPRVRKRRPKPYPLMRKPRHDYKRLAA